LTNHVQAVTPTEQLLTTENRIQCWYATHCKQNNAQWTDLASSSEISSLTLSIIAAYNTQTLIIQLMLL